MFTDVVRITIRSGRGGDGHVSFRRELYVPNGGPDGGDGGKGGDLIFEVDKGINTLNDFRGKRKYSAGDGEEGGKRRCHGKNGSDLVLKVPYGTVIKKADTGQIITDMSGDNLREVVLKGGRGGLGNMHFATSVMQAPRYAKSGQEAMELDVVLELKCIADVGLVGFPNVGKSTLISRCSNARPEIANYHFTTLQPHLGVVELGEDSFIMADIPGLIEGASDGAGLGHDFLRHIQRCSVLVQVVDAAGTEGRDPTDDIKKVNEELSRFDPALLDKPMIIAANKTDAFGDDDEKEAALARIRDLVSPEEIKVYPISAVTGEGVRELLYAALKALRTAGTDPLIYRKEYDVNAQRSGELPFNIYKEAEGRYVVEGPKIDKMLGYTNLEDNKGFRFFQNFMKEQRIIDRLKDLGLKEGDTVEVGGMEFEYYD